MYTLRIDTMPILDKNALVVELLKEVRLMNYPKFDEAFIKLFGTGIEYFDHNVARHRDLKYSIEKAVITAHGSNLPIMFVELPEKQFKTSVSTRQPDLLYINKGNSHQFLSEEMRHLFEQTIPSSIEQPRFPIGMYSKNGKELYPPNISGRNFILNENREAISSLFNYNFQLEQKYRAFNSLVPNGQINGIAVKETTPFNDLEFGLQRLLRTDLNSFDHIVAYNIRNDALSNSLAITTGKGNIPLISLQSVPFPGKHPILKDAGVYLHFHDHVHQLLANQKIPDLQLLRSPFDQRSLLLGTQNINNTQVLPTDEFNILLDKLKAQIVIEKKHLPHGPAPGIKDNKNWGKGIH